MNIPHSLERRAFRLILVLSVLLAGLGPPELSAAVTRIWKGGAGPDWGTPQNWIGGVTPLAGDSIVFPANTATETNRNTLSRVFKVIRFSGNYVVSGVTLQTEQLGHNGDLLVISNAVVIQPNGAFGTGGTALIYGRVTLAGGQVTLTGLEQSFFRPLVGPGGLTVAAGFCSLGNTNDFSGPVLILTNATLGLYREWVGATGRSLGDTNLPITVEAGGRLVIGPGVSVPNPIYLAGAGVRGSGALSAGSTSGSLNLILTTNATLRTSDQPAYLASLKTAPGAPGAVLTLVAGLAPLSVRSVEQTVNAVLQVAEGGFELLPPTVTRPNPANLLPTFTQGLIVGTATGTKQAYCDLVLLSGDNPSRLLPTYVFGPGPEHPQVPVTVHANGLLSVGPVQAGLGNPLTLAGGQLSIIPPGSGTPGQTQLASTHDGDIVVTGPRESKLVGALELKDVTVRSTNAAVLRVGVPNSWITWLMGNRLTVEGAEVVLLNTRPNTFSNLVVRSGRVRLTSPQPSAAKTNVVGGDPGGAAASLVVAAAGAFPLGASLELQPGGTASNATSVAVRLGELRLRGGRSGLKSLTVDRADFGDGSILELDWSGPLRINGAWDWSGDVTPALPPWPKLGGPGSRFTLISYAGAAPIPGRFAGWPEGGTFTNGGDTFQVSYTGGDGNDLVVTVVGAPPVAPAPPVTSVTPDGRVLLRWPADSAGCQLQFRPRIGAGVDWVPVEVPPAVDGTYLYVVEPGPESGAGFYRLFCP